MYNLPFSVLNHKSLGSESSSAGGVGEEVIVRPTPSTEPVQAVPVQTYVAPFVVKSGVESGLYVLIGVCAAGLAGKFSAMNQLLGLTSFQVPLTNTLRCPATVSYQNEPLFTFDGADAPIMALFSSEIIVAPRDVHLPPL